MQMTDHVSYVVTDPANDHRRMWKDVSKWRISDQGAEYDQFLKSRCTIIHSITSVVKRYPQTGEYHHSKYEGEGEKSTEDFWVKAERLLYSALIGYIWYEAPEEEQNFSTLWNSSMPVKREKKMKNLRMR